MKIQTKPANHKQQSTEKPHSPSNKRVHNGKCLNLAINGTGTGSVEMTENIIGEPEDP